MAQSCKMILEQSWELESKKYYDHVLLVMPDFTKYIEIYNMSRIYLVQFINSAKFLDTIYAVMSEKFRQLKAIKTFCFVLLLIKWLYDLWLFTRDPNWA